MKKKVSKKAKRRMTILTCLLIGLIVILGTTFFTNWVTILENKKAVADLTALYEELLEDESALKSEVVKLQDPDYVARYAREKYLYSKNGEIIIRIPDNEDEEQ